jgi:hypothetical protein
MSGVALRQVATPTFSLAPSGLPQRACACGGSAGFKTRQPERVP